MILSKINVPYFILFYDYYWKTNYHFYGIFCCGRLSCFSCVRLLKDNVSYRYSSIQEYRWCSCLDACCLFQSWMFLQDKAWGLVFHWGRRTQLGTEPHLLCWIPSRSKTLPSNLLWHKKGKQHTHVEDTILKNESNQHNIALKQMETHSKKPTHYSVSLKGLFYSIYLLSAPVGRKLQADREIQFCCQSGWALWHPSDKETRQHTLLTARPNLQTHRTDPLDTAGTHLQTQMDSFDLSPSSKTSYLPGEINHQVAQMVAHCCFVS